MSINGAEFYSTFRKPLELYVILFHYFQSLKLVVLKAKIDAELGIGMDHACLNSAIKCPNRHRL